MNLSTQPLPSNFKYWLVGKERNFGSDADPMIMWSCNPKKKLRIEAKHNNYLNWDTKTIKIKQSPNDYNESRMRSIKIDAIKIVIIW